MPFFSAVAGRESGVGRGSGTRNPKRNETLPFFLGGEEETDHPGGSKGPPQEGALRNETMISMEGMVGPARRSERAPFFARRGRGGTPGDSKGPP